MNIHEVQEILNKVFVYKSDDEDIWTTLRDLSEEVKGDCEDYALTLVWHTEDASWLKVWWGWITMTYVLWYATAPNGEGHVLLWVQGHGWTDNIQKKFVTRSALRQQGYRLWFPYVLPLLILKLLWTKL